MLIIQAGYYNAATSLRATRELRITMTSWLLDEGAAIPIWGALQCPHDLIFRLGESTQRNSQRLQAPRLGRAWLLLTAGLTPKISMETTAQERTEVGPPPRAAGTALRGTVLRAGHVVGLRRYGLEDGPGVAASVLLRWTTGNVLDLTLPTQDPFQPGRTPAFARQAPSTKGHQ